MKKMLVIHTGGTISMINNPKTGAISPQERNPLLDYYQESFENVQEVIIEDFFHIPSPHMTPDHMLLLSNRVKRAIRENISAVVITHGTDTLEETSYFLDLTIGNEIPIIFTGAMRSSNEIGSDGDHNYLTAIRVAMDKEVVGKGVLIVMNDEIHTARNVTKTHTTNVATFRSPVFGPIGLVTKQGVIFYNEVLGHETQTIHSVEGIIPILKAYTGMEAILLDSCMRAQIDGLVIEAFGAGNLPPSIIPEVKKLSSKGIPIVLVSRCFNGMVEPLYDYEGGGRQLEKLGVIFCNGLNSQKARLKLLVGLNAALSISDLTNFFSDKREINE